MAHRVQREIIRCLVLLNCWFGVRNGIWLVTICSPKFSVWRTRPNREWVGKRRLSDKNWACPLVCLRVCVGCLVFCCPICCASKISKRIGEHCCVPCMVPGAIITMRTKIRLMLGIRVRTTFTALVLVLLSLVSFHLSL